MSPFYLCILISLVVITLHIFDLKVNLTKKKRVCFLCVLPEKNKIVNTIYGKSHKSNLLFFFSFKNNRK